MILPQPNKCPINARQTMHCFLPNDCHKFYKNHTICIGCENVIEDNRDKDVNCKNCLKTKSLLSFSTFDVKKQLELILSNKDYVQQIHKSVSMARSNSSFINSSSIDGSYYRNELKKISNDTIISLNLNSDGAPLTNYKSFSIWPVIGTIIELNHSSREKFENIIVFGMWINRQKPIYNKFFSTVFKELEGLINKNVKINGKQTQFTVYISLIIKIL